jgi:hypothetical protein
MNYHNHAPQGGVAREYVAAADAENLVRWMTAYAKGFRKVDGRRGRDRRLDALWRENRKALERTAPEANR